MFRICSVLAFACVLTIAAVAPGLAQPQRVAASVPRPDNSPQPLFYGWPQLLRDPTHSSVALDPNLKASTASTLGIHWMAAMRSADLGSPVSAYSTTFKKTLVYVGGEKGNVTAFDEATGATIWSTSVGYGDAERASPAVAPDGSVWVATAYGSSLYKLDGTTGAISCSVKQAINFDASPMFVTPRGGVPTVYIATNDSSTINGPTLAVRQSDCQILWSFTHYNAIAGAWASTAYGLDVNGRPLVFEGTADPDSTLYAIDANTGALAWFFRPNAPPGNYDIAAAATVSPPGDNGFANGVVYVTSKYGIISAVDISSGKLLWEYNFNQALKLSGGGRSSAALEGNMLVFGLVDGVLALNATTGAPIWHYIDPTHTEVISSPAVVGPLGDQIVAFGDTAGAFHVLRLTDGTELYHYQTGGYITASPAVINDHILIDSSDGFLYDFAAKGGNVGPPATAITSPAQGAKLSNPDGNLTVQGNASDASGVTAVQVSVQAGGPTGLWYNAATQTWVSGPVDNLVAVANPNSPKSNWSFPFPIPASGSSYQVFANAVDVFGQVDRTGAQPTFSVMPSSTEPTLALSALFVAPGTSFTVTGNAFVPGETVAYSLEGKSVGSAVANPDGSLPAVTITVATTDAFGLTNLVATGQRSGSTTAPLNISNIWSQAGYGPTRTSYEPDDTVFAQTLQATAHGYVSRAWLFMTGAAIDASPAVAAGNAFVGNDMGQMYAVDTISGAPLWNYTTPTGAPIHASPAVDINAALLFFGSDDGTLYTLSATTGAFVGSAALNGIPTAPSIANGRIYLGTDAGSVLAIDEATGAGIWMTALTAAVHSPPAVDLAKSTLVVGDDSGAVTALNTATGSKLWSFKTGNAVTSSPAINAGSVYVGSTDGNAYILNESSGALIASFAAGSPIHTGMSLPNNLIVFGTDKGTLYGLTRAGKLSWSDPFYKKPIVGVSSAQNVPWVETSSGMIGASKSNQTGRIVYSYQTGAGLSTEPALVNGAAYIGAEDGGLYAFTPFGFAPQSSKIHDSFVAHAKRRPPARWTHSLSLRNRAIATRSFAPFGPREFPLHVDRAADARAIGAITGHGGPTQTAPRTYLIYWGPAGSARPADLSSWSAVLRQGGAPAGVALDKAPYPRGLNDAAVQREIAREFDANRWKADLNAQVFVVTAAGAMRASDNGFCAYHSAFDLDGDLQLPVPYAFVASTRAGGCGTLAQLMHREQIELQSDPLLNAWHDERGVELTH